MGAAVLREPLGGIDTKTSNLLHTASSAGGCPCADNHLFLFDLWCPRIIHWAVRADRETWRRVVASVEALELRARLLRSVPAHLKCRRAEFVQVQCPVDGCHVVVPWVSRRGRGWCGGGTSGGVVRLVSGPVSSQETGPSAASCRSRRSSLAQSIV